VNVLEARDITVTVRRGESAVPAIHDLTFALAPRRMLGLVGESGAGKSMIGRTIAQLLPPGFDVTTGSLLFEGEDLLKAPPARRRALLGRAIGFIPQSPMTALNPVKAIGAQFDEHLKRLGRLDRDARRTRMVDMLAAARLPDPEGLLARYPHQLSGGMCQRVLIAFAFASDPKLVIADEPTTALDVTLHPPIIRLIADMQKMHDTGVIFITHDMRLAAQICDEVIVMYAGRAVERGPARQLLSSPAHPYTRCLQLSAPSMQERRALYVLPDQMPSLRQLGAMRGCRFAPRCPIVQSDCRTQEPPDLEIESGHFAACLHAARSAALEPPQRSETAHAANGGRLLEVLGLHKHYGAVAAVKNASFTIEQDEFLALVGESGSGKSTLAKILVGLEAPTAGHILLGGQEVSGTYADAHQSATIQMIFQDPQSALNPRRRIASIVTQAMEAGHRHATWDERLARTKVLLAEVGLPFDLLYHFPRQLSGGQRQRVNIARALCNLPKVLVADEIVSGLDVSIQAQLLNLLVRLRAELGFAMLLISHDLSVVRHLCSRVLVMYRGEIVEQGPVERVFTDPQHPHTQALLASVPPENPRERWKLLETLR
jgi:oligopeptide/dipeptide ABC transporter ATP-binding protein